MKNVSKASRFTITFLFSIVITTVLSAQTKKEKPLPNVTASEIWIDRFDNTTGKCITSGDWFNFTDKSNGGNSKISPEDIKTAYKTISERDNTTALVYQYTLNKGEYKWEPYVGIGISIIDSNISVSIENIKGIAYDYKGAKHSFIYQLSSVKDYAHYKKSVPESEEWRTMIIPVTELKQPVGWGKPVEFTPQLIEALEWIAIGKTGDTGTICIDNVRLLRKLPKAENITEPTTQLTTAVSPILTKETTRTVSDKVRIADWCGFSKAAYSLSFDDGLISHYKYAAPILDKYNLKATFYIISENLEADSFAQPSWRFGYWYQFIQLNQNGHELGSHSATHPKLTALPDGSPKESGSLQYELNAPIKALQKKIPGYKVLTFAYPFVDFNTHVEEETSKLYASSRGLGSGFNSAHPTDWMNIQAHTISYNPDRTIESDQAKVTELKNWITTNTIAKGGWTVYLAHDVLPFEQVSTATDSWHPVSSESFELFASWLREKQRKNELWVETVGNVTRYIKERDAVSIALKEETTDKLSLSVTDNLPDDLFNYPITIEITLPERWKKALVKQNKLSNTLNVSERKIILNVVPDQATIEISKVE
jgi:peptidoglycan/xylan/chitin deacetylase (PgdA/CDA1 family)